jgi:hypothetical protein
MSGQLDEMEAGRYYLPRRLEIFEHATQRADARIEAWSPGAGKQHVAAVAGKRAPGPVLHIEHAAALLAERGFDSPAKRVPTRDAERTTLNADNRICEFLARRGGQAFCDDCLRRTLGLRRRHQVQQATAAIIRDSPAYRRELTFCAACSNERLTLRAIRPGF